MSRYVSQERPLLVLPFKVAEQGPDQLPDAAVSRWHHALQAHDQVPVVFGMEDDQLVLPRGNAHSGHLKERERERVMRAKAACLQRQQTTMC